MITNVNKTGNTLCWTHAGKEHQTIVPNGIYVADEKNILVMDTASRRVFALDASGKKLAEIANTQGMRLRCLQRTTGVGLFVLASMQNADKTWSDKQIRFSQNRFVIPEV